jgi:hypothetical protein
MASHFESPLREPLIFGNKTYKANYERYRWTNNGKGTA